MAILALVAGRRSADPDAEGYVAHVVGECLDGWQLQEERHGAGVARVGDNLVPGV